MGIESVMGFIEACTLIVSQNFENISSVWSLRIFQLQEKKLSQKWKIEKDCVIWHCVTKAKWGQINSLILTASLSALLPREWERKGDSYSIFFFCSQLIVDWCVYFDDVPKIWIPRGSWHMGFNFEYICEIIIKVVSLSLFLMYIHLSWMVFTIQQSPPLIIMYKIISYWALKWERWELVEAVY